MRRMRWQTVVCVMGVEGVRELVTERGTTVQAQAVVEPVMAPGDVVDVTARARSDEVEQ